VVSNPALPFKPYLSGDPLPKILCMPINYCTIMIFLCGIIRVVSNHLYRAEGRRVQILNFHNDLTPLSKTKTVEHLLPIDVTTGWIFSPVDTTSPDSHLTAEYSREILRKQNIIQVM